MTAERVEKLLEDIRHLSEEKHALVQQVRELVLSAGADVGEEVKYGGILFSTQSPFCGVFSYTRHVSLEFSEGAALLDPQQVLEGGGKRRRHIKLRETKDLTEKQVFEYIRAAYAAVGQGHGTD